MKQKILHIICIALGIVFIVSGFGKIIDTASFGNLIAQYGLGWLQISAPVIVLVEIAVGLSLILSIKPKQISLISFVMLVIFTLAFTYGYFKHGVTDCGCFGALKTEQNNIFFFYLRNFVLLGLSLFVYLHYPANQEEMSDRKKMILLGVLLPMLFVAGLTYRMPYSLQQNKPHILLNKHIKDTPLSQYVQTDSDKSYLVFFYSYSCPHCCNSIENFKRFEQSTMVDSLISFVFVDADLSNNDTEIKNDFIEFFGDFGTQEIVNDSIILSLIPFVPTSFYIKDDTIKAVINGMLPSPYTFQKSQNVNK